MLFFHVGNSFSHCCAIMVEDKSQKIDDLPVLGNCQSDTLQAFPSKLTILLLMHLQRGDCFFGGESKS